MFDGAFSPWHIAVLALVVFLIFGPRKIADGFGGIGRSVQRLVGDDDEASAAGEGAEGGAAGSDASKPPAKRRRRSLAYRLGRLLKRRPKTPRATP